MSEAKQKRMFVRKSNEFYTIDFANESGDSIENRIITNPIRVLHVVEEKIAAGFFISENSLSKLRSDASRF